MPRKTGLETHLIKNRTRTHHRFKSSLSCTSYPFAPGAVFTRNDAQLCAKGLGFIEVIMEHTQKLLAAGVIDKMDVITGKISMGFKFTVKSYGYEKETQYSRSVTRMSIELEDGSQLDVAISDPLSNRKA